MKLIKKLLTALLGKPLAQQLGLYRPDGVGDDNIVITSYIYEDEVNRDGR